MTNRDIASSQLSASSEKNSDHVANHARFWHRHWTIDNTYAWMPSSTDALQWLQVSNLSELQSSPNVWGQFA